VALAAIIFGGSVADLLSAQSNSSSAAPLAPYHFEVASIKLNRTGGSSDADFLPGGRFRGRNLSVRKMIQMATMVEDNQMIGVPAWTDAHSFFDRCGSEVVVFGPGHLRAAHRPDEHLDARELVRCARVFAALIADAASLSTAEPTQSKEGVR